jgi:hypothetical protein
MMKQKTTINSVGDSNTNKKQTQAESKYLAIGETNLKKISNMSKLKFLKNSKNNIELDNFSKEEANLNNFKLLNDLNDKNSFNYNILNFTKNLKSFPQQNQVFGDSKFKDSINNMNQSTNLEFMNTKSFLDSSLLNSNINKFPLKLNTKFPKDCFLLDNHNSESSKVACNSNLKNTNPIFKEVRF